MPYFKRSLIVVGLGLLSVYGASASTWQGSHLLGPGGAPTTTRALPYSIHEGPFRSQESFEPVIYQTPFVTVTRRPNATDDAFKDLYFAHLPLSATPGDLFPLLPRPDALKTFSKKGYAVLQLEPGASLEALSAWLHKSGLPCGALFRLYGDPLASGAGHSLEDESPSVTPLLPLERNPQVVSLLDAIDGKSLRAHVLWMSSYPSRFHRTASGQSVALALQEKYLSLVPEQRTDIAVRTVSHGAHTPQSSLVVRIEGTAFPQETVILGSHIDSVNWQDGGGSPGADDNASGTATNLEILRALLAHNPQWRPQRTLEIHGYAAEEVGLVGSQDLAKSYRAQGRQVVAMVQFDMNLYRDQLEPQKIWFIKNYSSQGLNEGLGKLVDVYLHLPWEVKSLWGGSSDHESWNRQGYATAFPFESPQGYNRRIHTASDTWESAGADAKQAVTYARLGAAFVAHFAGGF